MALTGKQRKKYNEKECWDKYMEMGSGATIRKLNNWHTEKYGFASQMGPYWAMWRYACQNPEVAYQQYKQWYFETATVASLNAPVVENPNATFENFLEDCRRHIKGTGNSIRDSIIGNRAYKQFCQKYGLEE